MVDNETTYIEEGDVYVCDNCGAYAPPHKTIKHHTTCRKGESKYWEKFYNEANKEE